MSKVTILDASAVLAFLQGEPGDEIVRLALQSDHCMVTAANQAEIIAKIDQLGFTVIDVTAKDGECAGWMRAPTRMIGLGLGDRLCLAVAQRLKAVVITADRPWLTVAQQLGLDIRCIRPEAH